MPKPLHRNRVLRGIERFKGSETAAFLENSSAPAVDPGTAIEDALNQVTLPECTVGLAGTAGNPTDFEELITRWKQGGLIRGQLNPIALARIWVAIYRTYYDWVTQVGRTYPVAEDTILVTENTLIDYRDYEFEYKGLSGRSGIKVLRDGYDLTGTMKDPENNTPQIFPKLTLGDLDIFETTFDPDEVEQLPLNAVSTLLGGPISLTMKFPGNINISVFRTAFPLGQIIDNVSPSDYIMTQSISDNIPGYFNWFHPFDYQIRSSTDGLTFDRLLKLGTQATQPTNTITQIGSDKVVPADPYRQMWAPSFNITAPNSDRVRVSTKVSAIGEGSQLSFKNGTGAAASGINLADWDFNGAGITLPTLGSIITVPTKQGQIRHIPTNTFHPYTISANVIFNQGIEFFRFSNFSESVGQDAFGNSIYEMISGSPIYNDEYIHTNLFAPIQNALLSYTISVNNPNNTVLWTTSSVKFDSEIYLNNVKSIEITSGFNDSPSLESRPYLCSYPYIKGTVAQSFFDVQDSTLVREYSSVDFDNVDYYSNNSPESYVYSGNTLPDFIALRAFQVDNKQGETNVNKWKLLPFCLPVSSPRLRDDVNLSYILNPRPPLGFSFTEDYISNSLIPFPAVDQLEALQAQANIESTTIEEYYLRTQLNELLNDLVSYAKTTCLRFWSRQRLDAYNFRTYRQNVINTNPLLTPIEDLGFGTSNIRIIEIPQPADVRDIGAPASQLWFLSGGTSSRVDIDTAVLLRLAELTGLVI